MDDQFIDKDIYYRNLPHWQPRNSIFFITFRLVHSLPNAILDELRREREAEEQDIRAHLHGSQQHQELYRLNKKYFGKTDAWLDRCLSQSPRWLEQQPVAQIVIEELHRLDRERFILDAFCIMPNHVHLLIDTINFGKVDPNNQTGTTRNYPLTDSLRLLKGRTARFCNQAIGRSGAFWQDESYDHVVHDEHEYQRVKYYICNNPVKAGLVSEWDQWPFTYLVDRDSS